MSGSMMTSSGADRPVPPREAERGGDPGTGDIRRAIDRFLDWLARFGYTSYDQYDFWSTGFGRFARRLYYRRNWLGAPLVGPLVALDMVLPRSRMLVAKPVRFPIADAHFVTGFLRFFRCTGDEQWRARAQEVEEALLESRITGGSGAAWGYPFNWETAVGLFTRGTPLITTTPYCYEACCMLFDVLGDERFRGAARSSVEFALHDLNPSPAATGATAWSYSPVDRSKVVNANAYRAAMLADAAVRFGRDDCREAAERSIDFVLRSQRPDGSWPYEVESRHNDFVDNFHTCFVLKGLFRAWHILRNPAILGAIERGYAFYRAALLDADGLPKPFAVLPRTRTVHREMYDVAEGIALGVLLRDLFDDALPLARRMAGFAIRM
ncbi:MAG TPA: hypothetical protein VF889_03140 [Bacteroidota bacterium]